VQGCIPPCPHLSRSLGKITMADCDCAIEVGWGKAILDS